MGDYCRTFELQRDISSYPMKNIGLVYSERGFEAHISIEYLKYAKISGIAYGTKELLRTFKL